MKRILQKIIVSSLFYVNLLFMRVFIGADHAGFSLKEQVKVFLSKFEIPFVDVGAFTDKEPSDYPDFSKAVAEAVAVGKAEFGILICGTGIGSAIVANKFIGVRAAIVYNEYTAKMAKLHNNANVVVFPARIIAPHYAEVLLKIFLETQFEGGRHKRRVDKISDMEKGVLINQLGSLKFYDPEVFSAIISEFKKQELMLNLVASENMASFRVLATVANPMSNKYAEGYPAKRYYGGCEFVDIVEELAKKRVLDIFNCSESYFANVQPHSGTQANQAIFLSFLKPGDKFLGMDLTCGGHLSHGSPVNTSGIIYTAIPYGVRRDTELIDYDQVEDLAKREKPKMIIAGASSYPRQIDWQKFSEIAKSVGAIFLADIAHPAGLVAAGVFPSPVGHADFITFTTHKTMRGPRGAVILGLKDYEKRVNSAVFPGIQGGPFMHIIAAKAVCFKEAQEESFKDYQAKVLENARVLAEEFATLGYRVVTGGTDSHIVLLDLTKKGIGGGDAEKVLYKAGIILNKNVIPYDQRKPVNPSGLRLGTPSLTTRGMGKVQMKYVARLIDRVLSDRDDVEKIRKEVLDFCSNFPFYASIIKELE